MDSVNTGGALALPAPKSVTGSITVSPTTSRSVVSQASTAQFSTTSTVSHTINRLIEENKLLRSEATALGTDVKHIADSLHTTKRENHGLRNQQLTSQKHFTALSSKLAKQQEDSTAQNKKLQHACGTLKTKNSELQEKLHRLSETKGQILEAQNELTLALDGAQIKIDGLVSNLAGRDVENQQLHLLRDQLESHVLQLESKSDALSGEITQLEAQRANLEHINGEQARTIENQSAQLGVIKGDLAGSTGAEKKLKTDLEMARVRCQELEVLLGSSKEANQKLSSEVYAARAETQAIHLRESNLKREIEQLNNTHRDELAAHDSERKSLLADLPSVKQRKGEPAYDAIKRHFQQNLTTIKRLNIWKRDVTDRVKELPEVAPVNLDGLDVAKILGQARLEVTRLRAARKDLQGQVKVLDKRQVSLSGTVDKQDAIIKKLEKSSENLESKYRRADDSRKTLQQSSLETAQTLLSLRAQLSTLNDKLDHSARQRTQAEQSLADQKSVNEQIHDEYDVYLHGLWHKVLTCDILSSEEVEKLSQDNGGCLKGLVQTGVSDVIVKGQLGESRISELKRKLENQVTAYDSAKKNHASSLLKIETQVKKQEVQYNDHQRKMESKYTDFVKQLQSKGKTVESQMAKLQQDHEISQAELISYRHTAKEQAAFCSKAQRQIEAFQKSLGLSLGAVCGLISKNAALLNERVVLHKESTHSDVAHSYLLKLGTALENQNGSPKLWKISPILRFRRMALVVISANRLVRMLADSKRNASKRLTTANPIDASRHITVFALDRSRWPMSPELLEMVTGVIGKRPSGTVTARMSRLFPGASMDAEDSYALDALIRGYMKLVVVGSKSIMKSPKAPSSRQLLSQRLSTGLFSIIKRHRLERQIKPIVSLTFAASGVQRHILGLTEQLHSSEIERKQLRQTELKLREHVVKQRHALEMSDDRVRLRNGEQDRTEFVELKGDYDTLRTDYSELTKIMHQCEAELKLGLTSGQETPASQSIETSSSVTLVAENEQFHTSRSKPSTVRHSGTGKTKGPEKSSREELQTWLVAQKSALGRIDVLQAQITTYRQKLVNSQLQQAKMGLDMGDSRVEGRDDFDTRLDLSELK